MRMAIKGGAVWVADAMPDWAARAKKTGLLKADRKSGMLYGVANIQTLDLIREAAGRLPGPAEELRQELMARQRAVDAEREASEPVPLVEYPVKRKLFAHQVKGANMALIAMGIVEEG